MRTKLWSQVDIPALSHGSLLSIGIFKCHISKKGIFVVAHTKVFFEQFRVFVSFCGYVG